MSANDWIAQDIADMLDVSVDRPADVETTALGAAMLAGLGAGLFRSLDEAATMAGKTTRFDPAMLPQPRDARLSAWHRLRDRALTS